MGKETAAIDGGVFREVMVRFAEALEEHREEIDSLNVFPVPDGDTGTNLALTQRAVCESLEQADPSSLPEVGRVVTRAALMGARGNSGVILAQVLRGLTGRLCRDPIADSEALTQALERASEEARRAVARPVEGTALTVLAAAADAAEESRVAGADIASVSRAALQGARTASERTRDMLPELRAAGVVDAGGRGMVAFFDALSAVLRSGHLMERVGPLGPVGHLEGSRPVPLEQRYEVMFLWEGSEEKVTPLSRALNELGDSLVVVGGSGLYKVHLHTNAPDAALAAAGPDAARDVRVVDLEVQVAEHCVAGQARGVRVAEPQAAALIAVADGDGLAEIFRSLGATVVRGGPGNEPAVADLGEAIDGASGASVLILPNHPDVASAAERAAQESLKDARVVPSRSIVSGLSAAAAFNPMATAEENEPAMREVAETCLDLEVTTAERDADTPTGPVRAGDWLGLAEGEIVAVGSDPERIAVKLVADHRSPEHEILTVVVGADASDRDAEAMRAALEEAAPGLEVQVHRGGQPHHPYLIGLE